MLVEFGARLVMVALSGGFFQGAVHALDLPVGPRVGQPGKALLYAVLGAAPHVAIHRCLIQPQTLRHDG